MKLPTKVILSAAISIASLLFSAPARAQALSVCKDGTTSTAAGSGTCSGHGGVNAGAKIISRCVDGTVSNSNGSGACSGHGGVKRVAVVKVRRKSASVGSEATFNTNPKGAVARCKDGLYAHAKKSAAVCAKHGGVASLN
ncbi:MAG: DUF3761 domain-containing protein [Gemmatimonadaceae bacterium]|nr:DUF3761 domain-containing protein [Gemmatimonadaceae bacterium]